MAASLHRSHAKIFAAATALLEGGMVLLAGAVPRSDAEQLGQRMLTVIICAVRSRAPWHIRDG
jgi:hypothetical protein